MVLDNHEFGGYFTLGFSGSLFYYLYGGLRARPWGRQMESLLKRTYQPNRRKRVKTHGFRRRRTRDHQAPPDKGPKASRRFRLSVSPGLPFLDRKGAGMDVSLPPERRIRKGNEFTAVLRKGRKRRCPLFTLYILPTPSRDRARLGIIASRRVGGAVQRNRAKRLLREVFRLHGSQLPAGVDLVAVARNSIARARLEDVERAFRNAFHGKTNS